MSYLVPFDGSPLSVAALHRAGVVGAALGVPVTAVTAVPRNNREYALGRGWIEPGESFDLEGICERLERMVERTAPRAAFEHVVVGRHDPSGAISKRIRRFIRQREPSAVFVGSEDAGRSYPSPRSVGAAVVSGTSYDVVFVRNLRGKGVVEDAELPADA